MRGKPNKKTAIELHREEHPRVCGENVLYSGQAVGSAGTSPRMRRKPFEPKAAHSTSRNIPAYVGKPVAPRGQAHRRRNIPAYAGKTLHNRSICRGCSEHPRVCGENHHSPVPSVLPPGTSPRMRGKQASGNASRGAERNIPAYAGKHRSFHRPGIRNRNIPAYAGKTSDLGAPTRCGSEHPRVCGENLRDDEDAFAVLGTSPRMRGKRIFRSAVIPLPGNIPACAGKTAMAMLKIVQHTEHPRVRGENVRSSLANGLAAGTSPRARGKQGGAKTGKI